MNYLTIEPLIAFLLRLEGHSTSERVEISIFLDDTGTVEVIAQS